LTARVRGAKRIAAICSVRMDAGRRLFHPIHPEPSRTMNKAELVESVQKALGRDATKAAAEKAVSTTIDCIASALKRGRNVQLVGFGSFKVVTRKARLGVNPKTQERIKINASKSVKFSVGKELKSKL
jgi:nucleoid DNA-binding protein